MNALDWVLVVVALLYALSGYWQGFISGAFATAGLLLGGLLGIWLAPEVLGGAAPAIWVSLGALLIVLFCASVGQAILQHAGGRLRDQVTWQPARSLDAIGGAALSAVAVLLVSWALGVAVSGSRIPTVSPLVRSSTVLAQVDQLVPRTVHQGLQAFNDVVGSSFFPRYLEPFAPEQIVEVGPPPGRIGRQPGVQAAEQSVLKVRGQNGCGRGVEGTGFLYSPDRVMTNAHVVAGVDRPTVQVGDQQVDATVVHYDPDVDVAVLAVGDTGRPFLRFQRDAGPTDPGAVLGYPNDGPYNVQAARIRGEQRLRSPDIYGHGTVVREVYALRGLVRPGNSGGPLVDRSGAVVGVIFAASVSDPDTGYALTADQVAKAAASGLGADSPVSTQDCA